MRETLSSTEFFIDQKLDIECTSHTLTVPSSQPTANCLLSQKNATALVLVATISIVRISCHDLSSAELSGGLDVTVAGDSLNRPVASLPCIDVESGKIAPESVLEAPFEISASSSILKAEIEVCALLLELEYVGCLPIWLCASECKRFWESFTRLNRFAAFFVVVS
ncbi:hypothetical protein P171DRAFT_490460 [Karstenula rhodostoma CBS 690.94]|uniref:Uncharacterized protein n=1 Tax=Karstenula rhodostoma CBS 690.94 TaxID=1392251 RepID=A0A9P4U5F9_9PLEO|nr:hypothetical protein P171DRAFT_490460 [Karstenula rhodostoma CBS 690.94]